METLHFKTNVQIKSIIGKDLINDDNIALLELIKNSFDANATKVEVKFNNIKDIQNSSILIMDDGCGMDFTELQDRWLNIAYSTKKHNSVQGGRMMAGAKGVGRFSCDRLGEKLEMYTRKDFSALYLHVLINWRDFEVDDKSLEIQDVPIEYEFIDEDTLISKGVSPFRQGLTLEIKSLRRAWTSLNEKNKEWRVDAFIGLRRSIERLINPNQAFEHGDFGVFLSVPDLSRENDLQIPANRFIGRVVNNIFKKLNFTTTNILCETVDSGRALETTLFHRGEIIYRIKERNLHYDVVTNFSCSLYFLNPYSKAFFNKQTGIRSVDYGSVFLFLNGFRIPPYGDEGDDWLGLEVRKGQGYARYLGTRDIVGRIEIVDATGCFRIVSAREGLVENQAFDVLTKDLYMLIHRRLERYVVEGLGWDSLPDGVKIQDIERRILDGEFQNGEIVFKESDDVKDRRAYDTILSMLSSSNDALLDLYINERLIQRRMLDERQKMERDFETFLQQVSENKADAEYFNKMLAEKLMSNKALKKQLLMLSKSSSSTSGIEDVLSLQRTINSQADQITALQKSLLQSSDTFKKQMLTLQKQIEDERAENKKESEQRKQAEKRAEEYKKQVEVTMRKAEFYEKTSSKDIDALVHHVKNNVGKINGYIRDIESVIDSIILSENQQKLLDISIQQMRQAVSKSLKATDLIFRSDLIEADAQVMNLPSFIEGYLNNEVKSRLKIHFLSDISNFSVSGSKLDLALIIDNFVDNSEHWGAENLWFECKKIGNQLELRVYDDGQGLSSKYINNSEQIFMFGESGRVGGSGLGLYWVRQALVGLKAEISVAPLKKGIQFNILFK